MSFRAYEEDGAGQLQAIATRTKIAFNFANSSTNLVSITANGNLGLGTYGFGTNAEKVLAIYNGVEPTTSPGNQIAIFSVDVASAATLGLRTEASVAAETDETKFSHKLPIRINGAIYYVMLTAT